MDRFTVNPRQHLAKKSRMLLTYNSYPSSNDPKALYHYIHAPYRNINTINCMKIISSFSSKFYTYVIASKAN